MRKENSEKWATFSNQLSTGSQTGWAIFAGNNDDYTSEHECYEQEWQYRFSIKPTRENLEKAASALQTVAMLQDNEKHPTIKLRSVVARDGSEPYWDAAEPVLNRSGSTDRQQVGKELCVTVEDFDAIYHKELILQIWAALEKEGVEMGYAPIPLDEKALNAESNILLPIIYSAGKYNKLNPQRHGILHSENYNPKYFPDPLDEINITQSDLKKHGIKNCSFVKISEKQIQYQDEKNRHHLEKLTLEWETVKTTSSDELIENIMRDYFDDKRSDIPENKLPQHSDAAATPVTNQREMVSIKEINDSSEKENAIADLLLEVKNARENLIDELSCSDSPFRSLIPNAKRDEIVGAVNTQPQKMMELYRRSVHISHDIQATKICKEKIINAVPKSYRKIWDDKKYLSDFDRAKALLQDYAKNDSFLSRFFHAHMNRSYCKDVNEVLKNTTINDLSTLMREISKITIKTEGSLARRIAFIEAKTGLYCVKSVTSANYLSHQ